MVKTKTKPGSIKLGDKVKDSVTGFCGTVVAETTWLHGCRRLTIQPNGLDKDGKPQSAETFDELQMELVEDNVHEPQRRTGGPRDDKAALRR